MFVHVTCVLQFSTKSLSWKCSYLFENNLSSFNMLKPSYAFYDHLYKENKLRHIAHRIRKNGSFGMWRLGASFWDRNEMRSRFMTSNICTIVCLTSIDKNPLHEKLHKDASMSMCLHAYIHMHSFLIEVDELKFQDWIDDYVWESCDESFDITNL